MSSNIVVTNDRFKVEVTNDVEVRVITANFTPLAHVGSGGAAHALATASAAGFMAPETVRVLNKISGGTDQSSSMAAHTIVGAGSAVLISDTFALSQYGGLYLVMFRLMDVTKTSAPYTTTFQLSASNPLNSVVLLPESADYPTLMDWGHYLDVSSVGFEHNSVDTCLLYIPAGTVAGNTVTLEVTMTNTTGTVSVPEGKAILMLKGIG